MAENHLQHFDTQKDPVLYTFDCLPFKNLKSVFIIYFFSAGIKEASPIHVNEFSLIEGTEW